MCTEQMTVKMFLTSYKRKLSSIIQKTKLVKEKAFLQWYEAPVSETDDDLERHYQQNKRSENSLKSHLFYIAICTPLMARAYT